MSAQTLLEMKNIRKQFPGVLALDDVSLDVKSGEVHALLGENGAGKSTLIKVLGGIYIPEEGEILIQGRKVHITNVHDSQACGVSVIHQELVLVPKMTVAENIFLGREPMKHGVVHKEKMNEQTTELLKNFDLDISPDSLIEELTIAQQQMVEITKALSFNSRILVMDEPTSSLSDKEVSFLFDTIRKLKQQGVGIIYISHRMSELNEISDRVTVMRDGEYIGTVVTEETGNDTLISMMVGRQLTNYYTRTFMEKKEKVLEVKNLSDGKLLKNISFDLHKGEILGFAGLVGAGRSEVMKCLFGLDPVTEGEFYLDGKAIQIHNPSDAMNHGFALVPESRKEEALFLAQSVKFNTSIKVLSDFIKGIFVNNSKEDEIADTYIQKMSIKTPSSRQIVENLSGGNQQKVVIGRWLATQPRILILDEPTRGVDVGAKAEIYAIMNELALQGIAIIMISSELPEVINMSDRVMVMCNGTITGSLSHEEMDQEKIMYLATQHDTDTREELND
ncbi:MAG: sugar ABC transporter ATP-binding protein [Spirochaetales bacterium]|nr:sugar ABC transporter ATP-binding protein [Spirochaetales bacterium]